MTSTPTPAGFQNAQTGLASSVGLAEVITVVAAAVAVILIIGYAASSIERYDRIRRAVALVRRSLELAFLGLVGVVVLGAVAAPAYVFASQPASTQVQWATYAGWGLVAFAGLAVFGVVVERVIDAIAAHHAELTADDGPDETPEPVADGGEPE